MMAADEEVATEREKAISGNALQRMSQIKKIGKNTMENKLQMFSVRQKCAHSTHTHHPRIIIMKTDLIYFSFTEKNSMCSETILNVIIKDELSFKKLRKSSRKMHAHDMQEFA